VVERRSPASSHRDLKGSPPSDLARKERPAKMQKKHQDPWFFRPLPDEKLCCKIPVFSDVWKNVRLSRYTLITSQKKKSQINEWMNKYQTPCQNRSPPHIPNN
jgi:hypothetical protein